MEEPGQAVETIQHIISIIEIIIWPLTLIIILILFKNNITGIFDRVGSFEASATGLSMTFQEKIEETKKLVPIDPLASISDGTKSKSSVKIPVGRKKSMKGETPYQSLLAIRDDLNNQIIRKAQQHNLSTKNLSNIEISDKLKAMGGLTIQKAKAFQALIELTNSADPSITHDQVNQVYQLFQNLNL
jgi:hypothetical protein